MPSSSKILRGLDVKGWRICYPRQKKNISPEPAPQEGEDFLSIPAAAAVEQTELVEEVLAGAREEGEKLRREILAEAVAEARRLGEKAREEGFTEGYREGEEAAQEIIEEARQTLKQAQGERQKILAQAEPEIISLAISIAEKLLNYTVNMDSRCVLALITRGLHALPAGTKVNIRVNPLDEKICRENFYSLQEMVKAGTQLEITADEKIPPGNCHLESEEMEVEILLENELQILAKKLLELAASSGQEYLQEAEG
ncbi:MAG: hypothetical protein GX989_07705 [Firmicutes bacterium]|nr:hypothetical protein [Bacillota bacterium]